MHLLNGLTPLSLTAFGVTMKRNTGILFLTVFVFLQQLAFAATQSPEMPGVIRIGLDSIKGKPFYHLIAYGDYTATGESCVKIKYGAEFIVKFGDNLYSIVLANETITMGSSFVLSSEQRDARLQILESWFPERTYSGQMLWIRQEDKAFPILYTGIEGYVSGLMDDSESLSEEVKKSQTILARTFALSRLAEMASDYDVTDSAALWHFNGNNPSHNVNCSDVDIICLQNGLLVPALYSRANESLPGSNTNSANPKNESRVLSSAAVLNDGSHAGNRGENSGFFGPDVGLNLNGAEQMAKDGKNYNEILPFYFQNAECIAWPIQQKDTRYISSQESFGAYYTVRNPDGIKSSCIVYAAPEEGADIIDILYSDSRILVYDINQEWAEIRHGLLAGFIKSMFLIPEQIHDGESLNGVIKLDSSQSLNMRREPGFFSDVLVTLRPGNGVHIKGEPVGEWIKADALGYSGYLHRIYLKEASEKVKENAEQQSPQETDSLPGETKKTVVVSAVHGLNMRAAPEMDSDVLMILPYGTTVHILGDQENFYKIEWNGSEGYISKDYVKFSEGIGKN